jgi:hypothetical protein
MIEAIQQNFLHPLGFLGLLGLIPLIIFYLVKPKPQEEIMPSMAFFTEQKKEGKIRNAFRTLKRNKLLLLHILFICLATATIANPLIPGLEKKGNAVIILDTSASMNDNQKEAKKFALKHLGETNTIITTSNQPEIQLRDASAEKTRKYIKNYKTKAKGTDLISAIQLASNEKGRIVIASDLSHTITDQEINSLIEETAAEHNLKLMNINHENAHGFVDLKFREGDAVATIQNFADRKRNLTINKPKGEDINTRIGALATKKVNLNLSSGAHKLSLPPDEFAVDNNLYVSIPDKKEIKVSHLGQESPYFKKAVELINSTTYYKGYSNNSDVYFVSKDYEIGDKITKEIKSDDSAVILESRSGVSAYAPVKNYTETSEKNVQVSTSITSTFTSSVRSYNVTGISLARPEEALVLSKDKNVLLYNVDDDAFGEKINYPVFWKNILQKMTDVKNGKELNIETGIRKNFESAVKHQGKKLTGYSEIEETGFYKGNPTYAANMLNPAESAPNINTASISNEEQKLGRSPAQKYLAALLAVIAALELTYLSKKGELNR